MRRSFFFSLTILISFYTQAQTFLYQEDFSLQNGQGAIGQTSGVPITNYNAVNWTLDLSQCQLSASSDWLQVLNEKLEGRDLDGEAIWYSPLINISNYPAVGFSLQASEAGNLEGTDYLICEYKLDAQNWQAARENGSLSDDFNSQTISHFGLNGNSLQLRVRFNNNASTEYLRIDDIEISAFQELLFSGQSWNRMPGIYSDSLDLRISNGDTAHISSEVHARNLILEAGSALILEADAYLILHGNIQNEGLLTLLNGSALVQSAGSSNSGSGSYQYTVDYLAVDHSRFSFWSSPMQSETIQKVFATTVAGDRYAFDVSTQSFVAQTNGNLIPGRGYAFTPSLQSSINVQNFNDERLFEGPINNGPISINLNNVQAGDWLLLGNPYPSPLNFESFIQSNPNLLGTVFYWDASTPLYQGAAYANWNSAGGNAVPFSSRASPSAAIAVAQGFMVQVDPAFTGNNLTVTFDNTMRDFNSPASPAFFKGEQEEARFWFSIRKNGIGSAMMISISEKATALFDPNRDAFLKPSASGLNLYSHLMDKKLSIQSLPWQSQLTIPVGMEIPESGNYLISLDSSQGRSDLEVYLYDKSLGNFISLKNKAYQIDFRNRNDLEGRFELYFSKQQNLANGAINEEGGDFKLHYKAPYLILSPSSLDLKIREVRVIDFGGRHLFKAQYQESQNEYQLYLPNSPTSPVLVQIQDSQGNLYVRKLFISQ